MNYFSSFFICIEKNRKMVHYDGMSSPFKGRSLTVINDLTEDEQFYLYQKTKELKEAILKGDNVDRFRLNDEEMTFYLLFLEDSTRTKESFRNAAAFHRGRVNLFDSGNSSFNKKESITDTVKMLSGYSAKSTFIIRSKQEGLCRHLDCALHDYANQMGMDAPVFINGGDGKHEHPTQELLDEYTFLEQLHWNREAIHVALVGDLFHGRTVHSKVDGLRIFNKVKVDLIAPPLLGLPDYYQQRMRENGYQVTLYEDIESYLSQKEVAPIWYFTRLQLERMGDEVKDQEKILRKAVTFEADFIPRLPKNTKFYHPLPRHREFPVIPTFLDHTPLNGWDGQSINGYYTRIMEIALLNGLFGNDFTGKSKEPLTLDTDFVEEVQLTQLGSPKLYDYKVGIKPVENGIVIDHLNKGEDIQQIWNHIDKVRRIMGFNYRSSHGVYHCNDRVHFKGIISLPDVLAFTDNQLRKLATISPGCTLNMIKEGKILKKFRLHKPPRVYGFEEISCENENCISRHENFEPIEPDFIRSSSGEYLCRYCERPHHYFELWDI